ncbi:MAG: CBS domain-containing protein [Spirochaetes bacterium]|nr:CBS domain-containing protein [Spirochaetota bacterium]MBU1082177.1 CBS domain-containing protein [Spirochaetota bacterium]
MKLANLLDPRLVLLDRDASTIDEAIVAGVSGFSAQHLHSLKPDEVLARIRERQALGGTVFPTGIAIPHARLAGFDDIVIAVVRPRVPIAVEGQSPVRLVWIVLTSQSASSTYLKVLANLALISKDEAAMSVLLSVESGSRFVEGVESSGYEVEKGLHVSDIMTRDVLSVRDDATLHELTDAMFANKLRYLPVVDSAGALVGEVGILDLIAAGIPDYVYRVGSLKFLDEFEPMEELLKNEDKILVRSIMKPPVRSIAPDSSVLAVAFEMTRSRKRHFPVVEGGRLVGVVSSMDILSKVLRA